VAEHRVGVSLEEHLVDGHVHGGDDLLRVAHQLAVQVLVKQPDVSGVDVQVGLLKIVDLES